MILLTLSETGRGTRDSAVSSSSWLASLSSSSTDAGGSIGFGCTLARLFIPATACGCLGLLLRSEINGVDCSSPCSDSLDGSLTLAAAKRARDLVTIRFRSSFSVTTRESASDSKSLIVNKSKAHTEKCVVRSRAKKGLRIGRLNQPQENFVFWLNLHVFVL